MRKQDKIVVWPVYFDSTKTREKGRRLPVKLCVPSPKISELKEAVERLGFQNKMILDKAYPKTPWVRSGMLIVAKKQPKNTVLKRIASELLRVRSKSRLEAQKRKKTKKR
jgi:signal recognition particle subunit SRP19